MSQQNKNKAGINTYLESQKLFRKQPSKMNKSLLVNTPQQNKKYEHGSNSANKYKYSILKDLKKQKLIFDKSPQIKERGDQSQISQTIEIQDQRESSPIKHQISINKFEDESKKTFLESPQLAWESQIVKSSRKYFDLCRGQAHDYIAKLQGILASDSQIIQKTTQEIRDHVRQSYDVQAQRIKQDLYLAVDEAVEKWKIGELRKSERTQINYIGELFELSTQIEERTKQMNGYKRQLQDEKNWKKRASDLLTTSYEEDIIQLSKLCQKSVVDARLNAEKSIALNNNNVMNKIMEIGKQSLSQKMKKQILDYIFPHDQSSEYSKKNNQKKNSFDRTVQKIQINYDPYNKSHHRRDIFNKQNSSTNRKSSFCESCSQKLKSEDERMRRY